MNMTVVEKTTWIPICCTVIRSGMIDRAMNCPLKMVSKSGCRCDPFCVSTALHEVRTS
jgi:hypothetical protein